MSDIVPTIAFIDGDSISSNLSEILIPLLKSEYGDCTISVYCSRMNPGDEMYDNYKFWQRTCQELTGIFRPVSSTQSGSSDLTLVMAGDSCSSVSNLSRFSGAVRFVIVTNNSLLLPLIHELSLQSTTQVISNSKAISFTELDNYINLREFLETFRQGIELFQTSAALIIDRVISTLPESITEIPETSFVARVKEATEGIYDCRLWGTKNDRNLFKNLRLFVNEDTSMVDIRRFRKDKEDRMRRLRRAGPEQKLATSAFE
ncbi:hypothetical protein RCL1_001089 [Eukaryota sp. TZLM3-RCL]